MAKIVETSIEQLIPDDKNFNKGTEFGQHLVEESLRKFGAGRSILIDKNNRIIAGNKVVENAAAVGLDNVVIVETDGTKIVAVKRNDIDLDTATGRELALADNATSKANLEWDVDILAEQSKLFAIEPEGWGVTMPEVDNGEQQGKDEEAKAKLIVECNDLAKLTQLSVELKERGFTCEMNN